MLQSSAYRDEPMPASLQLSVQFVEHDVRQQRRQRTALRRPFVNRTHQPFSITPAVKNARISLSIRLSLIRVASLAISSIVVDPIEEFLQIQIHHPAVAFGDILLRLGHRLMRRAVRAETRSCVPRTSGPTCAAAPASPPAG